MAAWQADFHVVLGAKLPPDYRQQLASLLPVGKHWSPDCEMWGSEDGDRVDVCSGDEELLARFDLRTWRPHLYERFITFVRTIGGILHEAENGAEVPLSVEAFIGSLQSSRAARFVRNPEAYFEELRANPIRLPKEP